MKLSLLALPAAFLLAFTALTVGCGDGADALTLDEYFEQFEAIDADVDAQFEAAYDEWPAGVSEEEFFADDANLPFFRDLIAAFPRIITDSIDRVEDLEPPSEVTDAHDDLLAAGRDLLAAMEEATNVLGGAETMEEMANVMEETEGGIDAAMARFDIACLAVVAIADANSIANNNSCEDDD